MGSLSILQYNVRKSRDIVMANLYRDPKIMDFDILAIQEPWVNPFVDTTHHPAKDLFHLCYPQAEGESSARVCMFINKRLDHTKWQFESHNRHFCTVTIDLGRGDQAAEIKIHNIYNPNHTLENRQSVMPQLRRVLESAQRAEQIVLGDFNLHHEMWGGPNVPKTEAEAEDLVDIMEDYNLTSTLIQGTITYEEGERQATIDLCLVTVGLADRVIRSEVDRDFDHDSDHLPVVTSFDLSVKQLSREPRKNWKSIDEKQFKSVLLRNLPPLRRPRTRSALDQYAGEIVRRTQELREQGLTIEIRWIPAHTGIYGNEVADQAAKEATGWRMKGPPGPKAQRPRVLHSLRSASKLWTSRVVNKRWQAQWRQETRGRTTFRHTPEPTPRVLQPHKNFSKRQSAIYVQLRTEKIGMNDFLFKRRVPEIKDPRCDCGAVG